MYGSHDPREIQIIGPEFAAFAASGWKRWSVRWRRKRDVPKCSTRLSQRAVAMNGLMVEVLAEHVEMHVANPAITSSTERTKWEPMN